MTQLSHDAAYKAFFSNKEMVKSLLLDFVPEDFIKDLDFSTLALCSNAYVTPHLKQRQDDIVWRIRWKNTYCYIYILLEFQRKQDHWMALRILAYTALLWESLIKSGEISSGDELPPIFPIVVYNGASPWNSPRDVHDLIHLMPAALDSYQPRQKYFLLDENRIPKEVLNNARGISSLIIKLECAKTKTEFSALLLELQQKFSDPGLSLLIKEILTWLNYLFVKHDFVSDTNEPQIESVAMLEEKIREWADDYKNEGRLEGIAQGKIEGIAQGKLEGMKFMLIDILADRFGEIPLAWQNKIMALNDPNAISKVTKQIYKMKTKEDFFVVLNSAAMQN